MINKNYDIDLEETKEWIEALNNVMENNGKDRVNFLIKKLLSVAKNFGCKIFHNSDTWFINTINNKKNIYPGNINLEKKIENLIRWNAIIMVVKANKKDKSLGGHIGSSLSISTLYEVGFNHFFKAANQENPGDLIFYQGHTTPVIYSRSYIEGRLKKFNLINFRKQAFKKKKGLSSYPHPYLQPNYWQFPTVSMGLGPLQGIYQARFIKYLDARNIKKEKDRKVWVFCGDGEMDEPESLGAINHAVREELDNLIFIVNCNLQRLDGLVHGNGKIIKELEKIFKGSGWNIIKIIWGSNWDPIFDFDKNNKLKKKLNNINDGELQFASSSKNGENLHKLIFSKDKELISMGENFSPKFLKKLIRGGHDPIKIFTAYKKAINNKKTPTVILPMTTKGYGLGEWGESKNIAHNVKKLDINALKYIKNYFHIPINKKNLKKKSFIKFKENSKEYKYIKEKRKKLNGFIPIRLETNSILNIPHYKDFGKNFIKNKNKRKFSTTTAFVRLFVNLNKNKKLKNHLVPITVDESRTFGMEGLFRQLGIYNKKGQSYIPEDQETLMFYKESKNGQIIQDGINEAGGFCSWLAAATSYSIHNITMIPFYIYYSMFGFQRIGDLAWAAGDSKAKGFLLGGTSGRTTLNGEGLQHEDGQSHIQANLIPVCISYDPTYAYELAIILWNGMKKMYIKNENIFYYITLMNENYYHKDMPYNSEENIIKGLYMLKTNKMLKSERLHVQLIGSGAILREVEFASELLKREFKIESTIWSMTSANEVYRNSRKTSRRNMFNANKLPKKTHIEKFILKTNGPVIAVTDYVKLYTEQLREFMPEIYITLGTDGYGRSDSRKNLRKFFEIDRYHIVIASLYGLSKYKKSIKSSFIEKKIKLYNINKNCKDPSYN